MPANSRWDLIRGLKGETRLRIYSGFKLWVETKPQNFSKLMSRNEEVECIYSTIPGNN